MIFSSGGFNFMVMKKFRSIVLKIKPYASNKFIVTLAIFLVWMTFFDENNFITLVQNRMKLAELEAEKEHYVNEIKESEEDLKLLQNDKELLEKFAREKYLMKKENEEIFVFAVEE
ncbi:MAG: septum formation initiator family protein [Flavobacteriales bacterium]|nr:septum formation initiator family protein [Flavobacteriales bacterium]